MSSAAASSGPVLLFDSGIGGLSVLREVRLLLPDERYVYVADAAAFPYGDWAPEALVSHVVELFESLIATHRPRLAIIACNSASTLVLPALRSRFSIPFVGTVPAIKPAAERTRSGFVSVLGTPGTVVREYTHDLIDRYAGGCEVELVGSSRLAELAERHLRGESLDDEAIRAEIAPCFVEREAADGSTRRTDIVVLACTHYPFLVAAFRRLAPWPVDWLDPAEAIARRARQVLSAAAGGSTEAAMAPAETRRGLALVTVPAAEGSPDDPRGVSLASGACSLAGGLPTGTASLYRAVSLEPRLWPRPTGSGSLGS